MNMTYKKILPDAEEVSAIYPITKELEERKLQNDVQIKNILSGKDTRLLLIIGPCSADREDSVLKYAEKLRKLQEKTIDKILMVPRVYTNKPRTTGDGYKGMFHQPDPNGNPDILKGLLSIRKLHLDVLKNTGFSPADEMLYPENYPYLKDLLSYVAVGARSVENQKHRLVSSGLDIPVGMKNPTSGDLSVMMNSITAAHHPHSFVYAGWEVQSTGNKFSHAILRGFVDRFGKTHPNYHYEDLEALAEMYEKSGLENPAAIIDVNHANSGKKYLEQIRISKEILHSMRHSDCIKNIIKGMMIESYLEDGAQELGGTIFGKSITDPCLGFEKTEKLVMELASLI